MMNKILVFILISFTLHAYGQMDIKKVEIVFYDSITEYNNIYEMLLTKKESIKDRASLGTKEERFKDLANRGANRSDIYKHYLSKKFKKIGVISSWNHISEIDSSSFDHYLVIRNNARIKEKTGRIFLTYICFLYDDKNKLILQKEDRLFFKTLKSCCLK